MLVRQYQVKFTLNESGPYTIEGRKFSVEARGTPVEGMSLDSYVEKYSPIVRAALQAGSLKRGMTITDSEERIVPEHN